MNTLFEFPPEDLLVTLVNFFFYYAHNFIPLLHEPSFRRDLASRRHVYDADFAQLLLMVCSIAGRFTRDPRVLLDDATSFHSAGFRFAKQVTLFDPVCLRKANLLQLQTYVVSLYDGWLLSLILSSVSFGLYIIILSTLRTSPGHCLVWP
jgi:hypothetical protein